MSFTLGEVVASALHTLGQGASSRYPPERLLVHANNGLLRLVEYRPEEFHADEWVATVPGVEQTFNTVSLVGLLAVRLNTDERSLLPFDLGSISAWNPAWRTDEADLPRNGLITGHDTFLVYPQPADGVQVKVRHVKEPTGAYTDFAAIALPRDYIAPLADYVAGMAELADEEHVNSQRAQSLIAAFGAAVRGVPSGKPA